MAKPAPFEEIKNGLPVWRLQVEDPEAAAMAKLSLVWRPLALKGGGVMALALKVEPDSGRPIYFHHAMLEGSLGLKHLRSRGRMLAVFERYGWLNFKERDLGADLGDGSLAAPEGSQKALEYYVEAYRRHFPAAGSPEGAWQAMQAELGPGSRRRGAGAGAKKAAWIVILLAAAAGAAWYFFKNYNIKLPFPY